MKQNLHNNMPLSYNRVAVLNIFLAVATIFFVIYYVIISNMISASKYKINLLGQKLADLTEESGFLTAQKLSVDGFSVILDFANAHHMTEAQHVTHIFEKSGVAIQR